MMVVAAAAVLIFAAFPAQTAHAARAGRTELPPTLGSGSSPAPQGSPSPGGRAATPTPAPAPGAVCATTCANGGSSSAGATNGDGNLSACAQPEGDAGALATQLMDQQYAAPERAAESCIRADGNLGSGRRAKLVQILQTAESQAGQGPAQYQEYVDLVTWAITGLTAGGPSWFSGQQPDTDGNPPTMAELYSDQDYGVNVPQNITGLFGLNGNEIPAFGFPPAVNSGQAVIAIGDFSFSGTWMTAGSDSIAGAVDNLYRALFLPYLAVVIVLSVLFMFLRRGHDHRGLVHVVSETGWMVLGILIVIAFQVAPAQLLQNANGLSTGIAQQVLDTAVAANPTLAQASAVYEPNPPPAGSLSAEAPALKMYDQSWWEQNVYDPWTLINFGEVNPTSSDGRRDLGTELLADEQITGGNNEFSSSNDLQGVSQQVQTFYAGSNPGLRIGYLALTYLNLGIAELLMVVIEVGLVVAYLGLLMAWLAIGVMGLLVVIPGKGREIAWSLCQVVIGLLTLRVIYAGLLALVMIITEEVIPAVVGGQSWGAQFVFGGAVFAAIFFMRRRLMAPIAAVIHGRSAEAQSGHGALQAAGDAGVSLAAESAWKRALGGGATAGAGRAAAAGAGASAAEGGAAGIAAGAGAAAGAGGAFSGFAAAAAPAAAVAVPFLAAGAVTYGVGSAGVGDVKTMMALGGRHDLDLKRPRLPKEPLRRHDGLPSGEPQPQGPDHPVAQPQAGLPAALPPTRRAPDAQPPPWMRLHGDDVVDAEWRWVDDSRLARTPAPAVAGLPPAKS